MEDWFVYILRCNDGSLYTGVARDVARRVEEHNSDNQRGAKYTRARRPVNLVYQEQVASRSAAGKREHEIKQLKKSVKEQLIRSQADSHR